METRLRKLNTSQLTEICRKMNCSRGSKKKMIGNLLRPLGKKYKMEKITDPRVKGEIMSFLTDEEASNFLVDRQNKVNLQWDMDKRARKHMTKIRKWNNLFNGKGVQPIPGEGKVPGPDPGERGAAPIRRDIAEAGIGERLHGLYKIQATLLCH